MNFCRAVKILSCASLVSLVLPIAADGCGCENRGAGGEKMDVDGVMAEGGDGQGVTVRRELGQWLLRHGRSRFRAGMVEGARRAAILASVMDPDSGHESLMAAIDGGKRDVLELPVNGPAGLEGAGGDVGDTSILDGLLDEARQHFESGDEIQARMSLEQALDYTGGDEKIVRLLGGLDVERNRPTEEAVTAGSVVAEARGLFAEGVDLARTGDVMGSHAILMRSEKLLSEKGFPSPFLHAIRSALIDAGERADRAVETRLDEIAGRAVPFGDVGFSANVKLLEEAIGEIEAMMGLYPESEAIRFAKVKMDKRMGALSHRWMAETLMEEELHGCEKAMGMYEEIAFKTAKIDPRTSALAGIRADSCRSRAGR